MKKTILPFLSIKLAIAGLMLAGFLLVSPSQMQAQTTTDYYNLANVSFVTPAIAMTRVDNKLQEINTLLGTLNSQSQEYLYATLKRDFYTVIRAELTAGKSVRESVEEGIKFLIRADIAPQLPKIVRAQFKQEATNLLKA